METTATTRHILIVEEDHALSALLADLLRDDGYQPDAAFTLEQALSKLDEHPYDLVLTDHLVTTPPRRGDTASLSLVQRLRQECYPTPVGLLTAWPIDQQEAEREGFAFTLIKPFDLDIVLQRIANRLNPPFTLEQQQQAARIRRLLEAISQDDEATLRALCAPTIAYYPLTGSLFTQQRAILGLEAYLAHIRQVRQRLPGMRFEQVTFFEQSPRLIARFNASWQGPAGTRQWITGSIQCHFRNGRISQIGTTFPAQHLRRLLEPPPDQPQA